MSDETYTAAARLIPANAGGHSAAVEHELRQAPTYVVRPAGKWELLDWREVWAHRQVFSAFLWRNISRRNRQTLLGPLWFVITPLVRTVLFTVALGKVARLPSEGIPYPMFVFAAVLPWELFSSGVFRSSESLVTYEHIISKVYFPRIIVPATEVLATLLDFAVALIILLGMTVAYGYPLTLRLFAIPYFAALALGLALSFGLLSSSLHARYRDVSKLLGYVIQVLFYGTPVAYSQSLIAHRLSPFWMTLYRLNPMYQVAEGMRWVLVPRSKGPDGLLLLGATAIVLVFLVIGAVFFTKTEHSIVDMI